MLPQEKCPIPETDHNISGSTSTLKGKKQEAEKKGQKRKQNEQENEEVKFL